VATGAGLSVVGILVLLVAIVAFSFLAGEPAPEENDQCLGGGHGDYAIVLVAVACGGVLASLLTLGQGIRGRRARLPGALAVALLALGVVLIAGMPITLDMDVGQC
jgi:hypothetical protein